MRIISFTSPERQRGLFALSGAAILSLLALAPTVQAAPPSFSKDVQPFLVKYCVECHGDKKPKKGLNFTSYESLMRGARQKPVVPGRPQNSLLVLTMESRGKKRMPPQKYKSQPTAKEIALIKAWVQAGAKDDSATGAAPPNRTQESVIVGSYPASTRRGESQGATSRIQHEK